MSRLALAGASSMIPALGGGAAIVWTAPPAFAQQVPPQEHELVDRLPDVVVHFPSREPVCDRAAPAAGIDLGCLNAELMQAARSAASPSRPVGPSEDIWAPSRVGTFSYSATAQRMGSNFGRAATPFRPDAPVHAAPLIPPGPRP